MVATSITDNPMGTDGFEFLEFSSPLPQKLSQQFLDMGFAQIAKHRFASKVNAGECVIPAIHGIGESVIYFIDTYEKSTTSIYEKDFVPLSDVSQHPTGVGVGLDLIDHVTHNVQRGQMDVWYDFYQRIFNFRQIRFFDIKGQQTGLISRALTSPCGKIKIPLNESIDDKSQIEEFLHEFKGEGIQHIALTTKNIYETVETLSAKNIDFLDVPKTYYEMVNNRVSDHQEDVLRLEKNKILIDGNTTSDPGLLLQIFTQNMLGPVFFEIIQRKGNQGFGEGNFKALFEAIERDQMRRGVL